LPRPIDGFADVAASSGDRFLVGTDAGAVIEVSPARDRELVRMPSRILRVAVTGPWYAALAADGTAWRVGPRGVDERTTIAIGGETTLAATSSGTVVVASNEVVFIWPAGTTSLERTTLSLPVQEMIAVTASEVAIVTADRATHLLDLETRRIAPVLPAASQVAFSADRRVAAAQVAGSIEVADLVSGESWHLYDDVTLGMAALAISPDGSVVVAGEVGERRADEIAWWRLDPDSGAAAWARSATNALPPRDPRGVIEWAPLPPP
jgi:hypothetical protein